MKRLLLMRHGDAVRGTPEMSDHERPLSEEGRQEVARTGLWLQTQGSLPDKVLCSSAKRTRQTLEALAIEGLSTRAQYSDQLYLASPMEMLARIREIPDTAKTALLIGHNPGIHDFCLHYAPQGAPEALEAIALGFKTGAVAILEFAVRHWGDMDASTGMLVQYHKARKA